MNIVAEYWMKMYSDSDIAKAPEMGGGAQTLAYR